MKTGENRYKEDIRMEREGSGIKNEIQDTRQEGCDREVEP